MELEGVGLAIWVACGFLLGGVFAMLCRGLGKSTERNPEFLANMGFFWAVVPAAMFGASAFYAPLDASFLAPFAYVLGIVPVLGTLAMRTDTLHAPAWFGADDQGRFYILGNRVEEVVTTLLYVLLAYEIVTIFLWDSLYRE